MDGKSCKYPRIFQPTNDDFQKNHKHQNLAFCMLLRVFRSFRFVNFLCWSNVVRSTLPRHLTWGPLRANLRSERILGLKRRFMWFQACLDVSFENSSSGPVMIYKKLSESASFILVGGREALRPPTHFSTYKWWFSEKPKTSKFSFLRASAGFSGLQICEFSLLQQKTLRGAPA